MKKTLITCVVVVGLLAIAGTAGAITCTIDQRPAATLLVPYFTVTFNPDGTPLGTGPDARDTLVTICNASSAPMIAHAVVFNERSVFVLDFNIALTQFDCQSMRMSEVLRGNLPVTGIATSTGLVDACQRNPLAPVYPDTDGFIRVRPVNPTDPADNSLATTLYPTPAFSSAFELLLLDTLDSTSDGAGGYAACTPPNGTISGPIRGYMTIDHANYCNLAAPDSPLYYRQDAIGNENNLFGEVIFTSGAGIPTTGGSTVNIEADASLDAANTDDATPIRTFYRRYWTISGGSADVVCNNCADGPDGDENNLLVRAPWDFGLGDRREPLGLKYAARWFEGGGINSFFNVWRGSSGSLSNLIGSSCSAQLPTVTLTFYDEDENTVTQGVCPSPPVGCITSFNFPLETQRTGAGTFARPAGAVAGWVDMKFFNPGTSSNNFGRLDQAWVEYDFEGPGAFLSASAPATQLDPTTCQPIGVTGVVAVAPAIPTIVGTGGP
ncbi:MAG TPA: hypothetical protein VGK86_00875 [Thermoanaerobaculia bacterium]|jgi:hypothetical protein